MPTDFFSVRTPFYTNFPIHKPQPNIISLFFPQRIIISSWSDSDRTVVSGSRFRLYAAVRSAPAARHDAARRPLPASVPVRPGLHHHDGDHNVNHNAIKTITIITVVNIILASAVFLHGRNVSHDSSIGSVLRLVYSGHY